MKTKIEKTIEGYENAEIMQMARLAHMVVFDGTSAYVIQVEDLDQEIEQNEVEVLGKFADFDEACNFCDKQNNEIIDPVH